MQMKLTGQLHTEYKSFEKDYSFDLEGNLIVLSGVNGSGKSQLLDVIRKKKPEKNQPGISVTITIDGEQIADNDIAYRSFKESINMPAFKNADPSLASYTKNHVWASYSKDLLNLDIGTSTSLRKSFTEAKNTLIEVFGAEKFNNKTLTHSPSKT